MDEKIHKWLYDILLALNEISSYFEKEISFEEYKANTMLKRATERDLEIIGEAMNRILKRDSTFENKISDAREIIDLRNLVIHAYDNISEENIWSVIIHHIPILRKEIENLLNE